MRKPGKRSGNRADCERPSVWHVRPALQQVRHPPVRPRSQSRSLLILPNGFEKISNFRRRAGGIGRYPVKAGRWPGRQDRSDRASWRGQLRCHWLNHSAGHGAALRVAVMRVGLCLMRVGAMVHRHRRSVGILRGRRSVRQGHLMNHRHGHEREGQDNEQREDEPHARPRPALLAKSLRVSAGSGAS